MSGVFQTIDPPPPSPPSECVLPPHQRRGVTHSPGGEGGRGSIFWKTPDIGLASYRLIPIRCAAFASGLVINNIQEIKWSFIAACRGKDFWLRNHAIKFIIEAWTAGGDEPGLLAGLLQAGHRQQLHPLQRGQQGCPPLCRRGSPRTYPVPSYGFIGVDQPDVWFKSYILQRYLDFWLYSMLVLLPRLIVLWAHPYQHSRYVLIDSKKWSDRAAIYVYKIIPFSNQSLICT